LAELLATEGAAELSVVIVVAGQVLVAAICLTGRSWARTG
jgi:hypothetical protein